MRLLYIVGCTGAGKDSLVDGFDAIEASEKIATIRIGRTLTARHPIEYFQGHIAPDHTQEEAMNIMLEGVGRAFSDGKKLCVVDGLPRKPWQMKDIIQRWPDNAFFIHLHCDSERRLERLKARDQSRAEKWQHTLKRFETDEVEATARGESGFGSTGR